MNRSTPSRIAFVDALRALAVMLMIQQHLQSWLWDYTWFSHGLFFADHPLMCILNFLGCFAAPLFFLLAGFGAAEGLSGSRGWIKQLMRGYVMLCVAYLLNLFSPHWFAPWSWYALHMIAAGIILSPLFVRMNTWMLCILAAGLVASTVAAQNLLVTPLLLTSVRMNDITMPGGVARLILAEGHFPLLPWLAFFIAGIVVQRMYHRGRIRLLLIGGAVFLVTGLVLRGLYMYGYAFAIRGAFMRLFVFLPYPYPALPSLLSVLLGVCLLLFVLFMRMERAGWGSFIGYLVPAGRSALSWFVFHILLVNELLRSFGIHKCFGAPLVLLLTVLFIGLVVAVSRLWSRAGYRFGIEWLVRRLAK